MKGFSDDVGKKEEMRELHFCKGNWFLGVLGVSFSGKLRESNDEEV